MPYARRKFRLYGRGRKRKFSGVSRVQTVANMAFRAYKGYKRIKRLINVEKKKYDISASTTMTTTGVTVPIHTIAEGSDSNQRDGTSIKPLTLLFRANVQHNQTNSGYARNRILIVLDTQQQSDTSPDISDIIGDPTLMQAPLKVETVGRYKILMDKYICTFIDNKSSYTINKVFKLQGHIRYNGTASTDIQKNGYYLIYISDQATNGDALQYFTRLTFTDN